MGNKHEDLLFKDVGEEEIEVLLKRIKIKSKKEKIKSFGNTFHRCKSVDCRHDN